jgi:hypothetical protein
MNPRRSAWGDFENTEHPYDGIIKDTAERYGLNHSLFRRQLYQESRFNPNAVSRAGAMGVGQIMPKTAKAYGVTDLNTLKDPFFNIDLAGRIMKDNLKYAKGNQYAALAMYNGGTAAMKNYLKGNYKGLPKETWNYIDIIGDDDRWGEQKVNEPVPTVNPSEPPKQEPLEKSLDPSEESSGDSEGSLIDREPVFTNLDLPEASKEIKPFINDPVDEDAVRAALANTTRSRLIGISFRSKRWADNRYVYDPSQDTSDEPQVGFAGGLKNGYLPTYLRMSFADGSIFGEQFAPTDEQRGEILGKVGYNMDRYYAVLNGATSMEDVEERLKINEEVIKYRQAEANAGWFSSITSSIGGAVVDPLSYVPALGAYGMAGRVLTGAALGAVSNQIDTYVSGAEHDIMEDMLVGAMFGAGIEFAFKGLGKGGHYVGDTARRAKIIREYQEAGKDLPSEVFDGIGGSTKVATSLNNLLDNIERRVPLVSTKGVFQALESANFRKFCESVFVDRGSGYVDENGVHYATRFQGQTVEEKLRAAQIDFENFESGYRDSFNNLRKLGHDDAEINLAICQAIENGVTPPKFVGNEEFSKIVESTKDFLQKTSKTGQRGGYVPRVSDPRKVGDLFDPNLPRGPQVERLVDELSHALVDGATSNPEVRQRVIDYYKKNVYAKLKAEREAQIAEQDKKKDIKYQKVAKASNKIISDKSAQASRSIERIQERGDVRGDNLADKYNELEPAYNKAKNKISEDISNDLEKAEADYDKAVKEAKAKSEKKTKELEKEYNKLDKTSDADIDAEINKEIERLRKEAELKKELAKSKAETEGQANAAQKRYDKYVSTTLVERAKKLKENALKAKEAKKESILEAIEAEEQRLKNTLENKKASYESRVENIQKRESERLKELEKKLVKDRDSIIEKIEAVEKETADKIKAKEREVSEVQRQQHKAQDMVRQEKFEDNLEPLPDEPDWADVLEWMQKEAREDALGWIDQGTSMGRAIITDGNIANIKYDPEVTRIPWDTSVTTRSGLSIDKMRRDPLEAVRMHHNKVIGDNILLSYGCENLGDFESMLGKMWSEEVNSTVGGRVDAKKFAQAQEQLINMIYNKHHSMSDVNSSWLGAMADVVRNLTFFSKNAMMGMANLFEQGEAIKHYGALHFFKGVPLVRDFFDNWAKNGMTNAEIRQAQSLIFGMSVRDTGLFRDIATESFEKQLRRFNGDKAKAILVAATDILAQASPFTKFIQNTENSIVEASQGMFLGELIQYAHNKSLSKKGFLNKELMQRNGISQENFDNLLKILKESTTVGKNKEITIDNLDAILSKDPAALATLRRMGDYVAHEVIQKNTLGDTFLWEGAQKNPFMQLLLQFKTFALRSYDKRLKKILGRMAEGDALGQAYSIFLSTALGTLGAMTNTLINTAGMNEEQRKEYLNKTLKYDPEEGLTLDTVMQVGINGAMRSSVFAFPSLLLNTAGVNTDVKTTTEGFSSQKERDELYGGFDADKWFRDMAPAYSTIKSFMDIVGYSANVARMAGDENYTDEQLENHREKAVRSIRNSTNIPFFKWGVYNMLSDKDE